MKPQLLLPQMTTSRFAEIVFNSYYYFLLIERVKQAKCPFEFIQILREIHKTLLILNLKQYEQK